MHVKSRLLASALGALLALPGCFGSVVTGTTGSGGGMDGGSPDAPMADGGTAELGESCIPERVDVACTGTLREDPPFANEPFALRLAVGGEGECYCGETVECAVSGDGEGVALETAVCSEGPLCDACFPYAEGECQIPALPPGRYPVSVNGEPALVLDLIARPPGSLAVLEACFAPAPIPADPACDVNALAPENFIAPEEICVPDGASPGRVTFSLATNCEACTTEAGSCRVIRSGNALVVSATPLVGVCRIGCPDICFRREWSCTTPPLEAGEYEVTILETGLTTDLIIDPRGGPGGETCLSATR